MWENLVKRLRGIPATPPLPEPDEKLAVGALMVRVAKSDHHYDAVEIGEIDRILAAAFDLNPVEAAKMRATCERLEAAAPGTPDFALIIRQNVDYPHRLEVARALWQVVLADGKHVPEEDASQREIEDMLGIDAADSPSVKA